MQKLQLAIPEPCHQDWADMTPNAQGRFCGSCAKTVVDFSAMTDAQLIFYFEHLKNEKVCGRVYPDQLDRTIQTLPTPKKKIFLYWQYVIAFFMMLGKGQAAKAQGEMKVKTVLQPDTSKKKVIVQDDMHIMLGKIARPAVKVTPAEKRWTIKDENGEPVANASLRFFPSGDGIAADENGMVTPGKNISADSVTISAVGYDEITIALNHINENITLYKQELLLGDVVVTSTETIRCTTSIIAGGIGYRVVEKNIIADTIQNILSVFDPALTVYPSPVSKGGTLNISAKLKQAGSYKIDINDANGRLLLQQNYSAVDKTSTMQIGIPATWSGGVYYMIVYNEKGKKVANGSFVIN